MWTKTLKLRVHANYLILGGINCGQNLLLKWGKVVIIILLSTARWQQYTFVGKVEDNLLKEFLDDSGKWTAVWDKLYLDTSQDDQSHLPWRWNSMSPKGLKFCWLVRRPPKQLVPLKSLPTENICGNFTKDSNYLRIETIRRTKMPLWQRNQDIFPNTVS